jgi:hypothetical protein
VTSLKIDRHRLAGALGILMGISLLKGLSL